MEPISSFHRAVRNLSQERLRLRQMIDALEVSDDRYKSSKIFSLWSRVDEIDRQVGVAYFWHTNMETIPPTQKGGPIT